MGGSTDYEAIAERYEEDRKDWEIPRDEGLLALLDASDSVVDVLEVGCGTANWLAAQRTHFSTRDVRWVGVDPSPAMLEIARRKLSETELHLATAEQLPFPDRSFDYLASNLAFHHFEDKPAALDEMARVLRPEGNVAIFNIEPSNMQGWWVYKFFPEARLLDESRFWLPERISSELKSRGFRVQINIETWRRREAWMDVVTKVERRTSSQLASLDDVSYERGLSRVRAAASQEPDGSVNSETARLKLTASRSSN